MLRNQGVLYGTVGNDLFAFFSYYSYWIVFFGVMLDNAGFPVPGEIFLLMAGAVIGTAEMDFIKAALVAITGAVMGGSASYYIGKWGGKRLIDLYCDYTLCTRKCSSRTETFYNRFGNFTIPVARFIMGVRVLSAPLAGAAKIAYSKFLILDAVGATVWTISFLFVGLVFADEILNVIALFEKIRHGFALIILSIITAFILFKLYRRRLLGAPDLRRTIQRLRSFQKKRG